MILRPMTHADIPAGLRLCRASNWNQLEDDWRFFLDHGGACLAERDGVAIGSVAWLPFGDDFAWLSMMLVDPAERRSGLGSALMEAALDALGPDATVRLDATPAGEPMYRRFGFEGEYTLARTRISGAFRPSPRAQLIRDTDLPSLFAQDRDVFGADRSALLAELHRRAPRLAWQTPGGYCFGRPGYLHAQIGPVVADSAADARELVEHCVAMHEGATFFVDITQREDGLGLSIERPFLRMSRGKPRRHGIPERVYAITGPEFG